MEEQSRDGSYEHKALNESKNSTYQLTQDLIDTVEINTGLKKTGKYLPSINDIVEGIKKHEKVQMLLTSGLIETSDEFKEAYEGKCRAWDSFFEDITEIGHDKSLKEDFMVHYTPPPRTLSLTTHISYC